MTRWAQSKNPRWIVDEDGRNIALFQREDDATRCVEAVNSVDGLREALEAEDALICEMQRTVETYLTPGNRMSDKEFITRIITLLDGERQREDQGLASAALAKEDS